MITNAQKEYILYLYYELNMEPSDDLDDLTLDQASDRIDELKDMIKG